MSRRRSKEIDEALSALGIEYDPGEEEFKYGRAWVEWRDVLAMLPDLSLDELIAYMEQKQEALP